MAALIEAIEIKRKSYFEYENAPYNCIEVDISKPTARGGQTLVRVKMRNLLTRAVFDRTFKAGEKFAEPDLVKVPATFLYSDGDGYHFMDTVTYDQVQLSADLLGDSIGFLKPEMSVEVEFFGENPIGVELPQTVDLKVVSTMPAIKGATATNQTKPATLETGVVIQVPPFIGEGDLIRVNTETGEYQPRA